MRCAIITCAVTLVGGGLAVPSVHAQVTSAVEQAPCDLYTTADVGRREDRVVRFSLRAHTTRPLDGTDRELAGIAVDAESGLLYAITGKHDESPGSVFVIDGSTGDLSFVLDTEVRHGRGLAVHPDGSWWTFEDSELVRVEPETGTIDFVERSARGNRGHHGHHRWSPLDLAWDEAGENLFAVDRRHVYVRDLQTQRFRRLSRNLPFEAAGVAVRADGLILVLGSDLTSDGSLRLALLDPETGEVRKDVTHPASSLRELAVPAHGHSDHPQHGTPPGLESREPHEHCGPDSEESHHGDHRDLTMAGLAWNPRCGNPAPGGTAELITDVTADRTAMCTGDTIRVSVETAHPDSDSIPVGVMIDGQPGSERFLQALVPGPYDWGISILAYTPDGYVEHQRLVIPIVECPDAPPQPILATTPNRFHEYTIDFQVLNPDELGDDVTYVWDFGDGHVETTSVPYAAHSFVDAVDPTTELLSFDTSVTVASGTARKTVALWNRYARLRRQGHVQPLVDSVRRLYHLGGWYRGSYSIRNIEPEPIRFTERVVRGQPCSGTTAPTTLDHGPLDLTVAGGATVRDVFVNPGALPAGTCGVELHLLGSAADGLPVTASAYFEVASPLAPVPVTNPHLADVLMYIMENGLSDDADEVTEEELDRLIREGRVPSISLDPNSGEPGMLTPSASVQKGLPPVDGERCIPGELPREGFVCTATDEIDLSPTYIANAFRGDSILSSGCGVVAEILSEVTPPQIFTHVGMMTQNYGELRSSTGSVDWLYKQTRGAIGVPGLEEDKLRYLWPGTVTQTVHLAYNGEKLIYGSDEYEIGPFNASPQRCGREGVIAYPSVIRPHPQQDALARPQLFAAADAFAGIDGHYRFYGYSDAAIARDPDYFAPSDAHFAPGSAGTVCSSTVWAAMNAVGAFLEGEIGPDEPEADIADLPGPELEQPDGIYLYMRDERLAAGRHLWDVIRDEVKYRDGRSGIFFGTPGRVAEQVVNCFAADVCETEAAASSDYPSPVALWLSTGDGTAVSPDDILYWDEPDAGGVYGYHEPMAYREGRYERVYVWRPAVPGTGTVQGTVRLQGAPIGDVTVTIDSLRTATRDDGSFEFLSVMAGTREVRATIIIGDQGYQGSTLVDVTEGGVHVVTIDLEQPDETFRTVVLDGHVIIRDDDVRNSPPVEFRPYQEVSVDPRTPMREWRWQECVGGEVVIRLDFTITLQANLSTDVRLLSRMWERRMCKVKDLADDELTTTRLAVDESDVIDHSLRNNEDASGGDWATIHFDIRNRVQR